MTIIMGMESRAGLNLFDIFKRQEFEDPLQDRKPRKCCSSVEQAGEEQAGEEQAQTYDLG